MSLSWWVSMASKSSLVIAHKSWMEVRWKLGLSDITCVVEQFCLWRKYGASKLRPKGIYGAAPLRS